MMGISAVGQLALDQFPGGQLGPIVTPSPAPEIMVGGGYDAIQMFVEVIGYCLAFLFVGVA